MNNCGICGNLQQATQKTYSCEHRRTTFTNSRFNCECDSFIVTTTNNCDECNKPIPLNEYICDRNYKHKFCNRSCYGMWKRKHYNDK
jgi:hypothetical protein